MPQTIIINYNNLCQYIDEENKKDPGRTWSYLDLLKENIDKNSNEILNWKTAAIDIDDNSKTISIFGEPLKEIYTTLIWDFVSMSEQEKQYTLFKEAQDAAHRLGCYEEIFETLEQYSAKNKDNQV